METIKGGQDRSDREIIETGMDWLAVMFALVLLAVLCFSAHITRGGL